MLCRLKSNSSTKFLLLYIVRHPRLSRIYIIKIARKHNLDKYIIDYVNGIDFQNKSEWKRLNKTAISDKFNLEWVSRVKNDQQLTRFNMINNITIIYRQREATH